MRRLKRQRAPAPLWRLLMMCVDSAVDQPLISMIRTTPAHCAMGLTRFVGYRALQAATFLAPTKTSPTLQQQQRHQSLLIAHPFSRHRDHTMRQTPSSWSLGTRHEVGQTITRGRRPPPPTRQTISAKKHRNERREPEGNTEGTSVKRSLYHIVRAQLCKMLRMVCVVAMLAVFRRAW